MIVRAIVADDERLARKRILRLLREDDWIEVVAECPNGLDTVRAVDRHRPDLLLLDVEMPGVRGIDLVGRLRVRPLIVFTTAYPEFAADAFDLNAVDYLRKPISHERFQESLSRVRSALERFNRDATGTDAPPSPVTRIFVRRLGKIIPIAISELVHIEADRDYVRLHTLTDCQYVRTPMKSLEARLDPTQFIRLHRSNIVNLAHVLSFRGVGGSRLRAELRNGTSVEVSRRRSQEIRSRGLC